MTDADTLPPCPHLEPCPHCGRPPHAVWRAINPHASCKTEDCFGRKMSVINLDDPDDVADWNRRAPPAQSAAATAGMEPVARIEGIDEYGPRLEWTQHWVDVGVGAKLFTESQVQAMLTAARR